MEELDEAKRCKAIVSVRMDSLDITGMDGIRDNVTANHRQNQSPLRDTLVDDRAQEPLWEEALVLTARLMKLMTPGSAGSTPRAMARKVSRY